MQFQPKKDAGQQKISSFFTKVSDYTLKWDTSVIFIVILQCNARKMFLWKVEGQMQLYDCVEMTIL